MKGSLDDVFINNLPTLDLHGEIRSSAKVLTNEFINDNYVMKNPKILIVHGVGKGLIKKEVYECLKHHKYVKNYHLNMFNAGCTVVYIKDKTT